MQAPHHSSPSKASSSFRSNNTSTPPLLDSSSEEFDLCTDYDLDELEKIEEDAPRKPHFLDYDYVPPPGYDDDTPGDSGVKKLSAASSSSTSVNTPSDATTVVEHKIDKKYERDGEISDSALMMPHNLKRDRFGKSFSTNTERGTTISVNEYVQRNLQMTEPLDDGDGAGGNSRDGGIATGTTKKKSNFLDTFLMPPPSYRRHSGEKHEREHRSLDRNFERYGGDNVGGWREERKMSLERDGTTIFASPKFLERDVSPVYNRGTWPTDKPNALHSDDFMKLGPKVECVYSLLSMLGSNDPIEMSVKFLEMSKTPETCLALRRSGCIPLLVQMIHSEADDSARKKAARALHNVVHSHPDDKVGRREGKVLRLIEQIMEYNDFLKNFLKNGGESVCDDVGRHPQQAIYSLMKVSFDEYHRHAMCLLGALPAIANLVYLDHAVHGNSNTLDTVCTTLRRYSGMALTNLTFGDGNNKALLCQNKNFMKALVNQLDSSPEELIQVTACVLRNLSWRADNNMKLMLTEIGTVTALGKAAMANRNENTLKSILSALWNLTAHCSMNKAELCNVEGALAFLADMLVYEASSKNLTIVENAGGILRNLSSHIAVREDYRKILRQRNCLGILLQQLKSESLTVVSNACGTLWNLSARCPEDQKFLCDNGAMPMLRSLVHSKHKMISNGSNAALKNLLNFKPTGLNGNSLDPIAKAMNLKELPTLVIRKQRALEEDLDQNLSETCENIDVITPPKEENNVQDFCSLDHKTTSVGFLTRSMVVVPTATAQSTLQQQQQQQPSSNSMKDIHHTEPSTATMTTPTEKSSNVEMVLPGTSTPNDEEDENFLKYSDESEEYDQLTDFSKRYNRETAADGRRKVSTESVNTGVYQETDLDQITDYSLRYTEQPEEKSRASGASAGRGNVVVGGTAQGGVGTGVPAAGSYGSEIIMTLEDTVKCYETEGTPYTISNATSMSDLRILAGVVDKSHPSTNAAVIIVDKQQKIVKQLPSEGTDTPEKPVSYAEEGTPGYFSRRDSVSSLDFETSPATLMSTRVKIVPKTENMPMNIPEMTEEDVVVAVSDQTIDADSSAVDETATGASVVLATTPGGTSVSSKNVTFVESFALETPLMFSRHSSLGSIESAEQNFPDDRSSVVSDFSRLASGIISPSELPDSPSQSMPQTPRTIHHHQSSALNIIPPINNNSARVPTTIATTSTAPQPPLRSVFEDDVNTFGVEHTPAQFSGATSLSNLSLDDEDEKKISKDNNLIKTTDPDDGQTTESVSVLQHTNDVAGSTAKIRVNDDIKIEDLDNKEFSDGEESANDDDLLLANCINIGMNRGAQPKPKPSSSQQSSTEYQKDDLIKYCTEDTPAILSKHGSNTNLSILSLEGSEEVMMDANRRRHPGELSDDSSNSDLEGHDHLLEQCIQDGMSKLFKENPIAMLRTTGSSMLPPYLSKDETNRFNVEDSPCNFSTMSALSNLTIDSDNQPTGLANSQRPQSKLAESNSQPLRVEDQMPRHSINATAGDDSLSSLSIDSEDDNNLLNQAIAAGFQSKPKSTTVSRLPSVTGAHSSNQQPSPSSSKGPPPPPVLTTADGRKLKPKYPEPPMAMPVVDANDSISSIDSSDSNDNQHSSLLEQCIRMGMNKESPNRVRKTPGDGIDNSRTSTPKKTISKIPPPIDRTKDRDKKDEQLLFDCINTGLTKATRTTSTPIAMRIPSGMRNLSGSNNQQQQQQQGLRSGPLPHSMNYHYQQQMNSSSGQIDVQNSKNGRATSVVVSDMKSAPSTATDVEKESLDGTNGLNGDRSPSTVILTRQNGFNQTQHTLDTSTASLNLFLNQSDHIDLERSNEYPALRISNDFTMMTNGESSHNISSVNDDLMNASNEFLMENDGDLDLNSLSLSQTAHYKVDKHKDPDLMLKSVERLTHELVSTAEYLRTNASQMHTLTNGGSSRSDDKKSSGSNTNNNNTWNEDTCPNDVSFPSISMTAPMIGSMNEEEDDATFSDINPPKSWQLDEATPTNEVRNFPTVIMTQNRMTDVIDGVVEIDGKLRDSSMDTTLTTQLIDTNDDYESLEPESKTLTTQLCGKIITTLTTPTSPPTTNGINFEVGGEVKYAALAQSTKSLMSNSIIALEAHKIVNDLRFNFPQQMTDSTTSLDLDNIRPPSIMENLSISGYFEVPHSPQLSRSRKKSLPAGLFARRALGHASLTLTNGTGVNGSGGGGSGSLESINSSLNLDNIKPPSLMDELLDSMISVASITSEVAEHTFDATSQYETALSDIDDTMTLQSCLDFPHDGSGTPIQSDFSSAETTPIKKSAMSKSGSSLRRSLTPKQKRQLVKDRYRTYTIAADMVLREKAEELKSEQLDTEAGADVESGVEEEILQIEIDEAPHRITPRQRRQENRSRFQTQILDSSGLGSSSSIEGQRLDDIQPLDKFIIPTTDEDDEDASLRALTEKFKHINGGIPVIVKPFPIAVVTNNDLTSLEFEQNSGTESCDQNETSDGSGDFRTFTKPTPRIVKAEKVQPTHQEPIVSPEIKTIRGGKKAAYVSPYRRTATTGGGGRTASPKHISPSPAGRTNLAHKSNLDNKKNLKSPAAANLIPRNQTIISKTHVIINKTNLSNKINASKSKATTGVIVKTGIQKLSKTITTAKKVEAVKPTVADTNPQLPDRQGTFVKDEPTNEQVPVVSSLPTSPSKLPKPMSSTATTKLPQKSPAKTIMSKLKMPIPKSASMDAGKLAAAQRKPPAPLTNASRLKSPSSTSSLSSNETITTTKRRSLGVFKSPSVPSVPQRSNSNITMKNNINAGVAAIRAKNTSPSTTPPSRSNSTVTKSNITSKIAGLWKKNSTDEIATTPVKKNTAVVTGVQKTKGGSGNQPTPPAEKQMIRSSTFDNTPEVVVADNNDHNLTVKLKNNNNQPVTIASRFSQIASKYRSELPSTSGSSGSKGGSKTSSSSPSITKGDDDSQPKSRLSRLGTFVSRGSDGKDVTTAQ